MHRSACVCMANSRDSTISPQGEEEQAALLLDEVGQVRSLLLRISGALAEPDAAEGVQVSRKPLLL